MKRVWLRQDSNLQPSVNSTCPPLWRRLYEPGSGVRVAYRFHKTYGALLEDG